MNTLKLRGETFNLKELKSLFNTNNDGSFKTGVDSTRGQIYMKDGKLQNVGRTWLFRNCQAKSTPEDNLRLRELVVQAFENDGASQTFLDKVRRELGLDVWDSPAPSRPLERRTIKKLFRDYADQPKQETLHADGKAFMKGQRSKLAESTSAQNNEEVRREIEKFEKEILPKQETLHAVGKEFMDGLRSELEKSPSAQNDEKVRRMIEKFEKEILATFLNDVMNVDNDKKAGVFKTFASWTLFSFNRHFKKSGGSSPLSEGSSPLNKLLNDLAKSLRLDPVSDDTYKQWGASNSTTIQLQTTVIKFFRDVYQQS